MLRSVFFIWSLSKGLKAESDVNAFSVFEFWWNVHETLLYLGVLTQRKLIK